MGRLFDHKLWAGHPIIDYEQVTWSLTISMLPDHKQRTGDPNINHEQVIRLQTTSRSLEHRSFMKNSRYFSHNRKVTRIITFF
jgi:hypothetical protein